MYPTNSPLNGTSFIAHPDRLPGRPIGMGLGPNPNGGTPYIYVNTIKNGVFRIKYDDPKEMVAITTAHDHGNLARVRRCSKCCLIRFVMLLFG